MALKKNKAAGMHMRAAYTRRYKQNERACYIMLSPQIIGFCVFTIIPLLWAVSHAWTYYDMISTRFVGMENFKILAHDATYWKSLGTTFLYALMKMPVELPIALILAVLLNQKIKMKGLFRGIYYMPHVISIALTALVFSNLFSHFGVINAMLKGVGAIGVPVEWFKTKLGAMSVIVLADIWRSFGVNVMYFISALANIPEELYESAKIDGANTVQCFFKITIPMIMPVLQIIIMLSLIGTMQINEMILVMTNGAPGGSTHSVQSYIFQNYAPGLTAGTINVGYGCAMALVTAVILAVITMGYMKYSNKLNDM